MGRLHPTRKEPVRLPEPRRHRPMRLPHLESRQTRTLERRAHRILRESMRVRDDVVECWGDELGAARDRGEVDDEQGACGFQQGCEHPRCRVDGGEMVVCRATLPGNR